MSSENNRKRGQTSKQKKKKKRKRKRKKKNTLGDIFGGKHLETNVNGFQLRTKRTQDSVLKVFVIASVVGNDSVISLRKKEKKKKRKDFGEIEQTER